MFRDIFYIICTSFFSVVVLFLLTKLIGKRQISQMSMFDYINGITIGSIAAEMATSLEQDWLKPLIAMVVYALVSIAISLLTCKSLNLRRLFIGKAIIVYADDTIYKKNLAKAKLDINEFLEIARNAGYFDLSKLSMCVLEANGKMSFSPKDEYRPLCAKDMSITPAITGSSVANVVMDGEIMYENLRLMGKNEAWLKESLKKQNINSVKEVFLATCDELNNFHVYKESKDKIKKDIWI